MPRTVKAKIGKRFPLSLRITEEMRTKLHNAAAQTGRSVSQEVEFRLERSFTREEDVWGGAHTERLLRMLAIAIEGQEKSTGKKWTEDDATRNLVATALPEVVKVLINANMPYFTTGALNTSAAPRSGPSAAEILTGPRGKR